MRHFKSLIFDSLSFAEGLITSLSTRDSEAPDFNRRSTNSVNLMAAINSLNRLICYKEWRKYQTCRVASSVNCLIK
jgi:hypothetical protein